MPGQRSVIRLRMSAHDAHYGGNLVDGARMLALFGDVATELCILRDGDEGLFRAYDKVEFLAPVRAGDFIEAEGTIISEGSTSRKMVFRARKVIEAVPGHPSHCNVLDPPVTVCAASGTCVVPRDVTRGPQRAPRHVDGLLWVADVGAARKALVEALGGFELDTDLVRVGRSIVAVLPREASAHNGGVVLHVDDVAAAAQRARSAGLQVSEANGGAVVSLPDDVRVNLAVAGTAAR